MSFNIEYAASSVCPFGKMTKDMLQLLKLMKTEKFICLQTLGVNDVFYTLRGTESEDDFSVGVENVMTINPVKIKNKEVIVSKGKNIQELAKDIDRVIIKKILEYGEDCEELEFDAREGLNPSIRSAGIALSSKLMRLSRLAIVSNKMIIRWAITSISDQLATIATNIDHIIVFNAGRNSYDGGVFFIPLSLDKTNGYQLEYLVITDESAINFIKLIESKQRNSELTLDIDLPEYESEFIKNIQKTI